MAQNVIAMLYDFDGTLSPGNMQKPLFEHYGIDEAAFFKESDALIAQQLERGKLVSKDTAYMHLFIQKAQPGGELDDLTEELLQELGANIKLFPGLPEFFPTIKKVIGEDEKYKAYGIKIEHHIVSTGLAELVRGSPVAEHATSIDACEFFYGSNGRPNGVARALTHMQKKEALFQVNKGPGIDVTTAMPHNLRRVPFPQMIYTGDGPTDVSAMSQLKRDGGVRFGVFDPNPANPELAKNPAGKVLNLHIPGRTTHIAAADFTEGSNLYSLYLAELRRIADGIVAETDRRLSEGTIEAPGH